MKIIDRATASAARHGIGICQGRPNPATGNCVFEASIFNVNDRVCFEEKFTRTAEYYRRLWISEGEKLLFHTPFNPWYSVSDWKSGFAKLKESNVYEVDFFGDMAIPSIACGIKKILLIFNTNTDFPRDPVTVVNPLEFGVQPTSAIPLVLAYDLGHYESLHPISSEDDMKCISLVQEVIAGNYHYTYKDLPRLVDLNDVPNVYLEQQDCDEKVDFVKNAKKRKISEMSSDELRQYNRMKKAESRANERLNDDNAFRLKIALQKREQ